MGCRPRSEKAGAVGRAQRRGASSPLARSGAGAPASRLLDPPPPPSRSRLEPSRADRSESCPITFVEPVCLCSPPHPRSPVGGLAVDVALRRGPPRGSTTRPGRAGRMALPLLVSSRARQSATGRWRRPPSSAQYGDAAHAPPLATTSGAARAARAAEPPAGNGRYRLPGTPADLQAGGGPLYRRGRRSRPARPSGGCAPREEGRTVSRGRRAGGPRARPAAGRRQRRTAFPVEESSAFADASQARVRSSQLYPPSPAERGLVGRAAGTHAPERAHGHAVRRETRKHRCPLGRGARRLRLRRDRRAVHATSRGAGREARRRLRLAIVAKHPASTPRWRSTRSQRRRWRSRRPLHDAWRTTWEPWPGRTTACRGSCRSPATGTLRARAGSTRRSHRAHRVTGNRCAGGSRALGARDRPAPQREHVIRGRVSA